MHFGDRAFSSMAPRLWNDLLAIRTASTLSAFRSSVKTHIFNLVLFDNGVFNILFPCTAQRYIHELRLIKAVFIYYLFTESENHMNHIMNDIVGWFMVYYI